MAASLKTAPATAAARPESQRRRPSTAGKRAAPGGSFGLTRSRRIGECDAGSRIAHELQISGHGVVRRYGAAAADVDGDQAGAGQAGDRLRGLADRAVQDRSSSGEARRLISLRVAHDLDGDLKRLDAMRTRELSYHMGDARNTARIAADSFQEFSVGRARNRRRRDFFRRPLGRVSAVVWPATRHDAPLPGARPTSRTVTQVTHSEKIQNL